MWIQELSISEYEFQWKRYWFFLFEQKNMLIWNKFPNLFQPWYFPILSKSMSCSRNSMPSMWDFCMDIEFPIYVGRHRFYLFDIRLHKYSAHVDTLKSIEWRIHVTAVKVDAQSNGLALSAWSAFWHFYAWSHAFYECAILQIGASSLSYTFNSCYFCMLTASSIQFKFIYSLLSSILLFDVVFLV